MKGIGPFIAFILVVAISVAGVVLVLRIGKPLIEKTEDFSKFSEAKNLMNQINSAVKEVSYEGNGSARKMSFVSSGGEYRVSSATDTIVYTLESEYELFSPGMETTEGDLTIRFYSNYTLKLVLNYTERGINITNNERWTKGSYNLLIKNEGYSRGKNKIRIEII